MRIAQNTLTKDIGAQKKRMSVDLTSKGYDLFEKLRTLRLEIAREENMPPYIIFNDRTLVNLCAALPFTKEEMLQVSGVGTKEGLFLETRISQKGNEYLDVFYNEKAQRMIIEHFI